MALNTRFYMLRLRNSSPGELFYRLRQRVALLRLRWSARVAGQVLQLSDQGRAAVASLCMPDLFPDGKNGPLQDTASMGAGHARDPIPSDGVPDGTDIRMMWEPARLQPAASLLALTGIACHHADPAALRKAQRDAIDMVLSWLDANPFPRGIHYQSAMECGLRIPVFFYALKRIQGLTDKVQDEILAAVYLHALLVSKKLSLYSSLGNHTICEAVGLIFAGAIYRSTCEGRQWLKTGIELLNDELPHQILEDGGPAEQSFNYHRFVMDLYWLASDFIRKNDFGDVSQWQSRLVRGESFLGAFAEQGGNWPSIGDSDDGFAVAPGLIPSRGAGRMIDQQSVTFKDSGYSILKTEHLLFSFDHGPLGMAPYYNHGHADALSVTLSKNGYPLLVDPGTYRYNGVPQWRRYFKGTRAHNTVNIDDQDQAVQETGFIWSKPYTAQLTATHKDKGHLFFKAEHDGYMRLASPVRHQRSVLFFNAETFIIKDLFLGSGIHCFQINFHLHPNAVADFDGKWWVVDHGGERICLQLLEDHFQSVCGCHNPVMGWFSSRYGHKEPTNTLTCTRTGDADSVVFTTVICTGSLPGDQKIDRMGGLD